MEYKKRTLKERLEHNTKINPKTQCIIWTGTQTDEGGWVPGASIGNEQKSIMVHRAVWEKCNGKIPEKCRIRHTCENILCVNLEHLYLYRQGIDNNEENPKRILAKVKRKTRINRKTGCWEWLGCKYPSGYGKINDGLNSKGKTNVTYVHRVVWKYVYGDTKDLHVLHKCDNPSCVNPEHLFLGTHADNMHDMAAKGRARTGSKKGRPKCKLDVNAVRDIRSSGLTPRELANKHKVCIDTIYGVLKGRIWTHVDALALA